MSLRRIAGTCGESTMGEDGTRESTLHARSWGRGRLRLRVEDYPYYCEPAPRFSASYGSDGIVLELLPIADGTPVARCTCYHEMTLTLRGVPTGSHRVVIETRENRPVLVDGRWVEQTVVVQGMATAD